jgi:hypothetical protein
VAELAELAVRQGLRRPPCLIETAELDVPSTWGTVRPVLAVPHGFAGWDGGRRRRVLLHELAHVGRRDAAWGLLAEAVTGLYWWNPLAWYAARRVGEESEAAADAHVLAAGARPSDYAGDLLAVARRLARPPCSRTTAGFGRGRFRERIRCILDPRSARLPARPARLASAFLTVVLLAPAGVLQPVHAARLVAAPAEGPAGGAPDGVAAPPWPAHQVRWARGDEAGGLFLEGDVDLARLLRTGELPATSGLLVWFHRRGDGSWESLAAGRSAGSPWTAGRQGGDRRADLAVRALQRSLREMAPDWRDHPGTSVGALAALPELAGASAADFSGSVILGVPGRSLDPTSGVLQAGWMAEGERIGVFARGPLELAADGLGLERVAGDGWFAAFGWVADTGRLRIVEALPGAAGRPSFLHTVDGEERPLDGAAREWLGRVLAELPRSEPGSRHVTWDG